KFLFMPERLAWPLFRASHNKDRVTFVPLQAYNYQNRSSENAMRALEREPDERMLIEAARQNRSHFAELYEQNFHRVYAFVARRTVNREEAQDLTAEVFHQALASLENFRWSASERATARQTQGECERRSTARSRCRAADVAGSRVQDPARRRTRRDISRKRQKLSPTPKHRCGKRPGFRC